MMSPENSPEGVTEPPPQNTAEAGQLSPPAMLHRHSHKHIILHSKGTILYSGAHAWFRVCFHSYDSAQRIAVNLGLQSGISRGAPS